MQGQKVLCFFVQNVGVWLLDAIRFEIQTLFIYCHILFVILQILIIKEQGVQW